MKLIDFLNSTETLSCELITKDLESQFSFEWDNDIYFTPYALDYFKAILESEIKIHVRSDNYSVVTILNDVDEKLYDLFMSMCAGYVSCTFYDKCVAEKKNTQSSTAKTPSIVKTLGGN